MLGNASVELAIGNASVELAPVVVGVKNELLGGTAVGLDDSGLQ